MATIFKKHLSVDASESCEGWTMFWNIDVLGILKRHMNSKNTYFSEYLSPFTACFSLCLVVTKVLLKAAGLFKYMYMNFCYHRVLRVIFISAENAFILAEWLSVITPCTHLVRNYTLYTKSHFYEIDNVVTNFLG